MDNILQKARLAQIAVLEVALLGNLHMQHLASNTWPGRLVMGCECAVWRDLKPSTPRVVSHLFVPVSTIILHSDKKRYFFVPCHLFMIWEFFASPNIVSATPHFRRVLPGFDRRDSSCTVTLALQPADSPYHTEDGTPR